MKSSVQIIAIAALAVACGDDPVAPLDEAPIGTLSFAYSGTVSGSYSVQGKAPSFENGTGWKEPHAIATINQISTEPHVMTRVSSSTGSKETSFHDASLEIPLAGVGTTTVTESCFVPGTLKCAYALFHFSVKSATGEPQLSCVLREATLTIANRTTTRVAGTFSGTAKCWTMQLEWSEVQVTGGVFDVPIIAR